MFCYLIHLYKTAVINNQYEENNHLRSLRVTSDLLTVNVLFAMTFCDPTEQNRTLFPNFKISCDRQLNRMGWVHFQYTSVLCLNCDLS